MPGPLPKPDRVRRNAPTLPTTVLPASGRTEPAPEVPSWAHLSTSGRAWWRWAWRTPQAAAWNVGDAAMIARRAKLEDEEPEFMNASERLSLSRTMTDLDDRLGLTPKGLAHLRWVILPDEAIEEAVPTPMRRLRAVDPHAVAGG